MSDEVAVRAEGVSKVFGSPGNELRALDDVTVDIRRNEFFTLLGPSGCGKTTLLRLIAGFETPSAGAIMLDGKDITVDPPFKRPINTVFQSYALFPHLTVGQNVGFGLEMMGRSNSEIDDTVEKMLALVQMEAMRNRLPTQLSGGQQQRVALARALAPQPSVLLLDEPLSALDLKLRKQMQIELKRMQMETGITFIFVTHDQEEALTMSDRIGVMSAGNILQIGSPREIYNSPQNRFVASFIGESNFLEGTASGTGAKRRVALADGHSFEALVADESVSDGKVTVAVRPEFVQVVAADTADALPATVTNIVYFGTDMHCYMSLNSGTEVVARVSADADRGGALETGAKVGITFAPDGPRIVGD
ncbi:ABC transporter ATP-binding protein [Hwanghaeella grinnelliae]|uniref:Spermidine/putrescine import ATP-binding protein PotA n=1 Tax=Hwanghaeella grinnelliae TaxID=2500179 RepID=A0A437QTD3_9PROT|nr:ABC transporter ATP-binding protein [Hwanghaeella grinnelliae]RVU37783.1 ABC transporter ATP-binding protein [Hwanghaeella grinnelliae]